MVARRACVVVSSGAAIVRVRTKERRLAPFGARKASRGRDAVSPFSPSSSPPTSQARRRQWARINAY